MTGTFRAARRLALGLAAAAIVAPAAGWSQTTFPTRPITIINPYATGSAADGVARALAEHFQARLGQGVVVVSRDGASGTVGMRVLAASAPDGHTIAYTPMTPLATQPHMVPGLGLSPASVNAVCGVTQNVMGVVVRANAPWRDIPALAAEARRRALTYGSAGPNSGPAVGVSRIRAAAGGEFIHIPFRGDGPNVTELLGGRLDFSAVVVSSAAQMVRAGEMRLLGVFARARHPDFPEVPTMLEQGIEAVQESRAALYAPRGTPRPVLAVLEAACRSATEAPEFRRVAERFGAVIDFLSGVEVDRLLAEDYEEMGRVLRDPAMAPG